MGLWGKLFNKKDPVETQEQEQTPPINVLNLETSDATPYAHELDQFM